jgi:hypothetical protein
MSCNNFEKGKEVIIFEKTCCTQRVIKPIEKKPVKPCCCKCFCCCPCCDHKKYDSEVREDDKEDC